MEIGFNYHYTENFVEYCNEFIEKSDIRNLEVSWYKHDYLNKGIEKKYLKQLEYLKEKYNINFTVHFPTFYDLGTKIPFVREVLKDHLREGLKYAEDIGADIMVIHPGTIGQMDIPKANELPAEKKLVQISKEKKENAKKLTIELLDFIKSEIEKNNYNVKIAVENLILDNEIGIKAEELLEIVKEVNSSSIGICLDYGHAYRAGENLDEYTRAVKDYLFHIHVSDNDGKCDLHSYPEAEGCSLPWNQIFETLHDVGYKKAIVAEIVFKNFQELNYTAEYLRNKKR